jgi:hypothetical protein
MVNERRIGAAVAAFALLTGLFMLVNADPLASSGPILHAPLTATVGTPYLGDASDNGNTVEVEVLLDGQPVPGLYDDMMDGHVNLFDFVFPESLRGRDVEVVATDGNGNQTRQLVHVT